MNEQTKGLDQAIKLATDVADQFFIINADVRKGAMMVIDAIRRHKKEMRKSQ